MKFEKAYDEQRFEYLLQFYTKEQIEKYVHVPYKLPTSKLLELWRNTQPIDVPISQLYKTKHKYVVDSPDGWVPVTDCVRKSKNYIFEIKTENGFRVKASDDHLFQKKNEQWISCAELQIGDILITKDGLSPVISKTRCDPAKVFDLSVDHENHRYYTGGISSHNTGKSLFLQNLALNWVMRGLNVVYITLELSEELIGLRFDAMITGLPTRQILSNVDDAALRLQMAIKSNSGAKWGEFRIKAMPQAGTTANDIRSYLKEYEVQTGIRPDALIVDYLDLLHPNNSSINASDLFITNKFTSEELRAVAVEWNILAVTASQLNRQGVQEQDFDASHIAGGISKINTADNVMAIFTSNAMRENGEYQIQFLKTRSSSGVGSKVILNFDIMNLRITDSDKTLSNAQVAGVSKIQQQLSMKTTTSKIAGPPPTGDDRSKQTRDKIRNLASSINNI